jgi:hypothetical protein
VWDDLDQRVQLLEEDLSTSADNFVEDERRTTRASLIDGVADISDLSRRHNSFCIEHSILSVF